MTVTSADVDRMTETLYIDGPRPRGRMSSKFWILLVSRRSSRRRV